MYDLDLNQFNDLDADSKELMFKNRQKHSQNKVYKSILNSYDIENNQEIEQLID